MMKSDGWLTEHLFRVRQHARQYDLLAPTALVVALSGGADSTCLLDALATLSAETGCRLHVAHFHHGLRDPDADTDVQHVAALCTQFGLPVTFGSANVRLRAKQHHESLEAAAHRLRWRFLRDVKRAVNAGAIAVGHTADDRAETVLLHLLRGTGLAGLAALPPRSADIIRPLLPMAHEDCVQWCQRRSLVWREDRSNAERWCLRNKIRLDLLPFMRSFNPMVDAALVRLAESAEVDDRYLAHVALQALSEVTGPTTAGEFPRLAITPYSKLDEAVRRRVLQLWLGLEADLETSHLLAVDHLLLHGRTGARIQLPGKRQVVRSYGEAVLAPSPAMRPPVPRAPVVITIGQTIDAPAWKWRITLEARRKPFSGGGPGWEAALNAAALALPLEVRPRRPGDRIDLAGLVKAKRLQDVLVDDKVPRELRDSVGVVTDQSGRIVCLVGGRIARWAAPSPTDTLVWRLSVEGEDVVLRER